LKIIYRAGDLTEAHIIAGLLEANAIQSHVGGHYLQGGIGELAAADFATVHVADEDVAQATAIIAEYESNNESSNKHITNETDKKHNIYITPIIVIVISLFLIMLLAMIFSSQSI
jgi:hypothetical protein